MDIERFEELKRRSELDQDYLASIPTRSAAVLLVIEEHFFKALAMPEFYPDPAELAFQTWPGVPLPTPDQIAEDVGITVRDVLDIVASDVQEVFLRRTSPPISFKVVETSQGPTLWPDRCYPRVMVTEEIGNKIRADKAKRKAK